MRKLGVILFIASFLEICFEVYGAPLMITTIAASVFSLMGAKEKENKN